MCRLKENREAAEEELRLRSAAVVQNAEEVSHQRAETNALRFVLEAKRREHLLKERASEHTGWNPSSSSSSSSSPAAYQTLENEALELLTTRRSLWIQTEEQQCDLRS